MEDKYKLGVREFGLVVFNQKNKKYYTMSLSIAANGENEFLLEDDKGRYGKSISISGKDLFKFLDTYYKDNNGIKRTRRNDRKTR